MCRHASTTESHLEIFCAQSDQCRKKKKNRRATVTGKKTVLINKLITKKIYLCLPAGIKITHIFFKLTQDRCKYLFWFLFKCWFNLPRVCAEGLLLYLTGRNYEDPALVKNTTATSNPAHGLLGLWCPTKPQIWAFNASLAVIALPWNSLVHQHSQSW